MSEAVPKNSELFVGREVELRQLHQALESVIAAKRPKFILVQGDYGVGKTALVRHFLREVSNRDPSVLIGQAKGDTKTEGGGYVPFIQLFKELAKQGIRRRIVAGKLLEFAREVVPAWVDVFTAGAATAAMKTVEESAKLLGRSGFKQDNVFVQFTNALSQLAEKRPIIAFIDDLHWADESSLSLLFHVARNLQDRQVLFLAAYRPVEAMETGASADTFRDIRANLIRYGATEVELQEGIDVAEYVAQRYPFNTFPADFLARVQERTGGHALHVSQLFLLWEATGVITSRLVHSGRDVWSLAQEVETYPEIPQLSEVLKVRIRLIEDELREILNCASVEGEDFTVQVVARLRQLDEGKVYEHLEALEDRYRLVQEVAEVDTTVLDFYRFVHRYFRDFIYNKLARGRRRSLHRQVGECLEALYSDRREIAGQLAGHFREAREPLKAARYALMAAQLEQSRYAWLESEKWCDFGLTLTETLTGDDQVGQLRLDLLECFAESVYWHGEYGRAERLYRDAFELGKQLGADPIRLAKICERLSDICDELDRYTEGMEFVELGKAILSEHGLPLTEVHLQLEAMEGLLHSRLGRYDKSIQIADRILADADKLPQTPSLGVTKAWVYDHLAIALGYLGRYSESIAAYRQAIAIAQQVGDKMVESVCLGNMSEDYILIGEMEDAERSISRTLEIVRQTGDLSMESYALAIRGYLFLELDKYAEAVSDLQQAASLSERLDLEGQAAGAHADLALAYLGLSNLEAAHEHTQKALALAADIERSKAYALDVLGQVQAAHRHWDQAVEHFEHSLTIREDTAADFDYAARTKRHYAAALLNKGERKKAIELLQSALAAFQELGLTREIKKTQDLLIEAEMKE